MSQGIANQIGPFMHADGAVRRRTVGKTTYVVGIAGAYNAFGLIGPEHNGLFVLDDTAKRVLTDRICENPQGGYPGPSAAQWEALATAMRAKPADFLAWVTQSPRYRG
jgi:hypothetical protein